MYLSTTKAPFVLALCAVVLLPSVAAASDPDDILIVPQDSVSFQIDERDILTNDGAQATHITSYTTPSHGTLTANAEGLSYAPEPAFRTDGQDHFSYTSDAGSARVFLIADELGTSRLTTDLDVVIESSPPRVTLRQGTIGPGTLPRADWTTVITAVEPPFVKILGTEPLQQKGATSVPPIDHDTSPGRSGGGKAGGGLDTGSLEMEAAQTVVLVRYSVSKELAAEPPNEPLFEPHGDLLLKYDGSRYFLSAAVCQDDGTLLFTEWVALEADSGSRTVAVRWWPASNDTSRDGGFALEIDDRLVASRTGLNNPLEQRSGDETFEVAFGPLYVTSPASFFLKNPTFVHLDPDRPAMQPIFADNAASGDLTAWSQVVGSGSMAVTGSAGIQGDQGFEMWLQGPTYLIDRSPEDVFSYRLRFLLDSRLLSLSEGQEVTVLTTHDMATGLTPFTLHLRRQGSLLNLCAEVQPIASTAMDCATLDEQATFNRVEAHWWASRNAETTGGLQLWIDASPLGDAAEIGQPLTLDNLGQRIEEVRFGVVAFTLGAAGKLSLDDFESWQ